MHQVLVKKSKIVWFLPNSSPQYLWEDKFMEIPEVKASPGL